MVDGMKITEESNQRISGCNITKKKNELTSKGMKVGSVVDLGLNNNKNNAVDSKTGGPSHISKAQTVILLTDDGWILWTIEL